jgi:MoaA/NifB/PqqE/SkfB family radical SAM enzyme
LGDYNVVLNNELEKTFLKYSKNKKTQAVNPEISFEEINKNIRHIQQIIIEISQRCNLSCAYCVYNGDYFFERKKSGLDMRLETAQAGLNYIHGILKDRYKKELKISFYGGEPLLRFDVLKEIVSYSKKLFKGCELKYVCFDCREIASRKNNDLLAANPYCLYDPYTGVWSPRRQHAK